MRKKIINMIIELTNYTELLNNVDVDLIKEDILDSLAFIELITRLEDEFNIEIYPTKLPKNTWNNIDNIVTMVKTEITKQH